MAGIYVKTKDKTSTCWLAKQNKSVVCGRPTLVELDDVVRARIKHGVLVKVDKAEFDRFEKALKNKEASKSQKLADSVDYIKKLIKDKNVDLVRKELMKSVNLGLVKKEATKFSNQINAIDEELKAEAKKLADEKEEQEHKESVELMVQKAFDKEVLTESDDGVLFDGSIVGKAPENVIEWVLADIDNEGLLSQALEALEETE